MNGPSQFPHVKIDIVTIFPKMVEGPLAEGIVGRAIERGLLDVRVHDLREHTTDRHRVVDDMPFGGGPGMVLKPEPLFARGRARSAAERGIAGRRDADVAGRRAVHARGRGPAERGSGTSWSCAAGTKGSTSASGEHLATETISIGDYVLSGGELPALVIVDAVARLVPGVVGDEAVGGARFVRARPARLSAVHAARGVPRPGGAAGAAVGASRGDRAVAAARGARARSSAAGLLDGAAGRRRATAAEGLLEQRTKEQS